MCVRVRPRTLITQVTGKRYTAGRWPKDADIDAARAACEEPLGWPMLVDNSFFVAPTKEKEEANSKL